MAKPVKPKYRVALSKKGPDVIATGTLVLTPDLRITAQAAIDDALLRFWLRELREGHDGPQMVGGIFDDIWAGAKSLAKKVTQSSVLRKVANTISNPQFTAALSIIPGVGPIAASTMSQVGSAWNGLRAATAAAHGQPDVARAISQFSAEQAAALGVPPDVFNQAQRYGASLAVDPQLLAVIEQQIPGGLRALMASSAAPPPPPPPPPLPRAPIPMYAMTAQQRANLRLGPPGGGGTAVRLPPVPVPKFGPVPKVPVPKAPIPLYAMTAQQRANLGR